ncbi:sigma E regulatory protein, MucB/RseB [mine drainage metagenome]|uniref:Sigma E regulatory protein, MucB/RseB n=1 Tax=mine drainage metagenome TaxID=410659 RepID=T1D2W0_9ZZZZ
MRARGSCLALLVFLPGVALASTTTGRSAEAYLLRMQKMLFTVNYHGIIVFQHNTMLKAIAITHGQARFGGWERISTLNGPPRELLKNGHRLELLFDGHPVRLMHVLAHYTGLPQNWVGFSGHFSRTLLHEYWFLLLPKLGRVADQPARIILIRPQDRYRYGYRLWLDAHNDFPLRSDLLNSRGQVIEQMMFVTVHWYQNGKWHEQPPVVPPVASRTHRVAIRIPQCRFANLPRGFRIVEDTTAQVPGPVRHILLSDGLASVSVFIHPLHPKTPTLVGMARMGPVTAFGKKIGSYSLIAIGEVPPRTVRWIIDQARLTP